MVFNIGLPLAKCGHNDRRVSCVLVHSVILFQQHLRKHDNKHTENLRIWISQGRRIVFSRRLWCATRYPDFYPRGAVYLRPADVTATDYWTEFFSLYTPYSWIFTRAALSNIQCMSVWQYVPMRKFRGGQKLANRSQLFLV